MSQEWRSHGATTWSAFNGGAESGDRSRSTRQCLVSPRFPRDLPEHERLARPVFEAFSTLSRAMNG